MSLALAVPSPRCPSVVNQRGWCLAPSCQPIWQLACQPRMGAASGLVRELRRSCVVRKPQYVEVLPQQSRCLFFRTHSVVGVPQSQDLCQRSEKRQRCKSHASREASAASAALPMQLLCQTRMPASSVPRQPTDADKAYPAINVPSGCKTTFMKLSSRSLKGRP